MNLIDGHLDAFSQYIALHSLTCEKVLILGDFNVRIEKQHMEIFCKNYNLTSIVTKVLQKSR